MSRVLCIAPDGYWESEESGTEINGPEYGDITTVVVEIDNQYEFQEFPGEGYPKEYFIPLSDKDETEYADEIMEKIFVPVEKH